MSTPSSSQPVVAIPVLSSGSQRSAWLDGIVDAWAMYLADLLSLRCSFFVRKGPLVRWIGEDPPTYDPSIPHCRACEAPLPPHERRILCRSCRKHSPVVELGPTLADVMQRTSHDAYVLDDTKKEVIRVLRYQQELAYDAIALPHVLRLRCYESHEQYAHTGHGGNVKFDRTFLDIGGSYDQSVLCGLSESTLRVGGLGADLRDRLQEIATEWLTCLDERVRKWFDIPVSNDPMESATVKKHIELFSAQIANRVALLEPASATKVNVLCVDGLEHRARVQYVNEALDAEAQCQADCEGMSMLARVARRGIHRPSDWGMLATPQRRLPLMEVLRSPPPELLRELRDVATHMHFATLRDLMGNANEASRCVTAEGVQSWREAINVEALCLLLERATRQVEAWRQPAGFFVTTLSRVPYATSEATRAQLRLDPAAILSPTPWARSSMQWQLVPRERLALIRSGLRPTGLRIVMLCSALRQLLGTRDDEPEVFAPGRVDCGILHNVCTSSEQIAEAAYASLRQLIEPLMTGVECAFVKHQLSNWSNSHLEDDLRDAFSHVCRFSLQELTEVFNTNSEHWDGHSSQLLANVHDRLVFKLQDPGFVGVVSNVVSFALPLLRQFRIARLGWSPTMRCSVAGEQLQRLPSVREWMRRGCMESLQITPEEVYKTSTDIRRLLEHLKQARLVRKSQVRINNKLNRVWNFNAPVLMSLLMPYDGQLSMVQ